MSDRSDNAPRRGLRQTVLALLLATAAPATAQVAIEKLTNGQEADAPPGPTLVIGSPVTWTYVVSNTGGRDLLNVAVTDDQGVTVTCPTATLGAGKSMTCTGTGTAQAGQYVNVGTVTADEQGGGPVSASDLSHYFGAPAGQTLAIRKFTNGEDANLPPGPTLAVGEAVTWTYVVTNPGPDPVTSISVTDDQGVVVTCPATTLAAGTSMTCTGSGTAQEGPYTNLGTVTGELPGGSPVSAVDPSHYFGVVRELTIRKFTNGEDANLPPGPVLAVGGAVAWTYVVTNTGTEPLTDIEVSDDQGVAVTCPATALAPGESMTCTGSGTAQAGQYVNVGTAVGTLPSLEAATASDPSHYFGQDQILDFGDAPDPTFPTRFAADGARHLLGSAVYLGACVDAELDGQPTAVANGDDGATGAPVFGTCAEPGRDEDGVVFSPLFLGTTVEVEVVANAPCTLSAWIDFNRDGDWDDAGETLFPGGQALAAGLNTLSFAVPLNATVGGTFSRFRCTTDGPVGPAGQASDGEVEDHPVALIAGATSVTASKTATLFSDADGDGQADPGDTLLYTVVIDNGGPGPATGALFEDTPDPNTAIVPGSVTTTQGTITAGNAGGDTAVGVDLGILIPGAAVTITFQVTIDDPLAAGVTSVSNQGSVTGGNFTGTVTDDPAVPGLTNPTVVAVARPAIHEVPTLAEGGLLALALLLLGCGLRALRS